MIHTAVRRTPSIAAWLEWIEVELRGRDGVYRYVPAHTAASVR